MDNTRSELKAGIVILISMAILAALIIAVGKFETFWVKTTLVTVRFKNIYGLKADDPVRYAGVHIGRVKAIKVVHTKDESLTPEVEVSLEVEAAYPMRTGATAYVDKTMMGATSVEINPGTGPLMDVRRQAEIPEEEVMSFAQIQKRAGELVTKAGAIMDKLNNEVLSDKNVKAVAEIVENARQASVTIRETGQSAADMLKEYREPLGASLANLKKTTTNVNKIIEENQAKINTIVKNVQEACANVSQLAEKLNTSLYGKADKIVTNLGSVVEENRDTIRQALRDVRDVASNFKLMSDDLYKHPWKLLNPPEKDVKSDNIATAAKEVTLAAEYIKDSASRLEDVAQKPGPNASGVSSEIKKLVDDLKAAVTHLQTSQEQLNKAAADKK